MFDFLGHPSCLYVTDPEFRTVELICELVRKAGDRARLCPECKAMRGAIASGKLTREMVAIDGGCATLMTSNDPAIVAKYLPPPAPAPAPKAPAPAQRPRTPPPTR